MGRFQRPTRDGGSSDAAAASGSRDAIIKLGHDAKPRPPVPSSFQLSARGAEIGETVIGVTAFTLCRCAGGDGRALCEAHMTWTAE